jgi:hypothetical protein
MTGMLTHLRRLKDSCWDALSSRLDSLDQTVRDLFAALHTPDLGRSKSELLVENAILRQQLIMFRRQVKRVLAP